MTLWTNLLTARGQRVQAGLSRRLFDRSEDSAGLDLRSNDYLNLSQDPRLKAAATEAIRVWGTGATASRLVAGSTTLHSDLERSLAQFVGTESALVFSSGYLANLALVTLADEDCLLVSDAANHASIIDAARLARAEVAVSPHKDVSAVAQLLANRKQSRAVVVTEAIFSVDGDAAPLPELLSACEEFDATLVVDEAHSIGVVGDGAGLAAATGLVMSDRVVLTATLSKAFGSQGGVVLGPAIVREHLINTARTFIFDTALNPAAVGAAKAALEICAVNPSGSRQAVAVTKEIAAAAAAAGWSLSTPDAAVLSLQMPRPAVALAEQQRWHDAGVAVGVFRPPSVPDGVSRLRLTGKAGLSGADLDLILDLLAAGPPEVGAEVIDVRD